jgi:hypothetical protein
MDGASGARSERSEHFEPRLWLGDSGVQAKAVQAKGSLVGPAHQFERIGLVPEAAVREINMCSRVRYRTDWKILNWISFLPG